MINWLVVYLPLWKILVSWNDSSQYMESHLPSHVPNHQPGFSQLGWWHSQYMEKYKSCSKPPISNYYCIILNPHYTLKTHNRFLSFLRRPGKGQTNKTVGIIIAHPIWGCTCMDVWSILLQDILMEHVAKICCCAKILRLPLIDVLRLPRDLS